MIFPLSAYFIGSIPFGLLFSRICSGIDPRASGSGNIGFTNVLRTAGKLSAGLTLIFDIAKGTVPVLLARQSGQELPIQLATAGLTVLGHVFPIYLGFRGGKGVATGIGTVLGLDFVVGLVTATTWVATVAITRFSSAGAIVAFAGLPILLAALGRSWWMVLFAVGLSGLVLGRHKSNMTRLWKGLEPRIGKR